MVKFEDLVSALEGVDEDVNEENVDEEILEEKLRTRIGKVTFAPNYDIDSDDNKARSLHRYLDRINIAYAKLEEKKKKLVEGPRAIHDAVIRCIKKIEEYEEEMRKINEDIIVYRITKKRPEIHNAPKVAKDMKVAELKAAILELKKDVKLPTKGGKDALIIMYNRLLTEQQKLENATDYVGALKKRFRAMRKLYEDEVEKFNEITIVKKSTYRDSVVNGLPTDTYRGGFNYMIQAGKMAGQDVSDLENRRDNYIQEHTINLQPIVVRVVNEELLGARGADFDLDEVEKYRVQYEEDALYQNLLQEINDKMLVLREQRKATLELLGNYDDTFQTKENFINLAHKLTEAIRNGQYYDASTGDLIDETRVGKAYSKTARSKKFRIVYAGDSQQSKQLLSAFMNVVESVFEIAMKRKYLPIRNSLAKDKKWIYLPIGVYANKKKVTANKTNHVIHIEDKEIPVLKIRNNPDDLKYREYLSEVSNEISEVVLKKNFYAREFQIQGFLDVKMTGFTRIADENYLKMKEADLLATGELKSPVKVKKDSIIPESLKEFVSEVYIPTMDVAYYKIMKNSGFVDEKNPLLYSTKYSDRETKLPVMKKVTLVERGKVKPQLYIKSKSTQTYLPIKIVNNVVQLYNPFSKSWIPIDDYIEQNSVLEREANLLTLYIITPDKMFNFKLDHGITNFLFRTSWTHPSNGIVRMTPVKCKKTVLVSDKTIGDLLDHCKDLSLYHAVKMFFNDFKQNPDIQDHTDRNTRMNRSQYIADMITRLEDFSGVVFTKVKSHENIYGLATRLLEFSKLFGDIDREIPHENKVREIESYIATVTGSITYKTVTELYSFISNWPRDHVLALSDEGFYPVIRKDCEYNYHSQLFARIRNSITLVPINTAEFSTLLAKQVGFEMATSDDISIAEHVAKKEDRTQELNVQIERINHMLNVQNIDKMEQQQLEQQRAQLITERERYKFTEQDQLYRTQYQNLVTLHPQTGEKRIEVYRELGVDPYIFSLKMYNVVEVAYKSKKRHYSQPTQHQPNPEYKPVGETFVFTG